MEERLISEFFTIYYFSFWYFFSVDFISSSFYCACWIFCYRRSFIACRCRLSLLPFLSVSRPGESIILLLCSYRLKLASSATTSWFSSLTTLAFLPRTG